jgi:dTMP kinase
MNTTGRSTAIKGKVAKASTKKMKPGKFITLEGVDGAGKSTHLEGMQPDTELLLMYAARAEHVATVIKPALAKGAWVLSDRFHDASFAYQCGGRGVDASRLRVLEEWTLGDFKPDLTLLFDVAPKIAAKRRARVRAADRFEQEQAAFFTRVRDAYLVRARAEPDRIRIVDSALDIDLIRADLDWILQTI